MNDPMPPLVRTGVDHRREGIRDPAAIRAEIQPPRSADSVEGDWQPKKALSREWVMARDGATRRRVDAFGLTELLVSVAGISLLLAVLVPIAAKARSGARLELCRANLNQVGRAVLQYADDHKFLPALAESRPPGPWWWYKEQVKGYLGLTGPPSTTDKVFACPSDRGYGEGLKPVPFCRSEKFDFTSYVFNGVNLPGAPHIARRPVSSIVDPERTLLVMEWTAHAPLSWHRSETGNANTPFYNNAESVVAFVDGHVALTRIYYDGYNAAFTRDPIPGYDYKYSGD